LDFPTGCFAPGFTCNDWGALRPFIFPLIAVNSKPPAVRMVVDASIRKYLLDCKLASTAYNKYKLGLFNYPVPYRILASNGVLDKKLEQPPQQQYQDLLSGI
jgi:hypothetical protein